MTSFHQPVLLREAIEGLGVAPGKRYIDATVGGGGHTIEILSRGGRVLGIDTDPEAIEEVKEILRDKDTKSQYPNILVAQGNFRDIENIAKRIGWFEVDGILFDLGVSSHQLDTPRRGFSYRYKEAPLDLRFDPTKGETAAELINRLSKEELYEILARFGEEQLAGAIAALVVRARAREPLATVGELVAVVGEVAGDKKINATLSRVFQALRIAVNDELSTLSPGLIGAKKLLRIGGRLVVISFHSLEDRIVKNFFRGGGWRLITKKPIVPGKSELAVNPKSRSAKLRIAEKMA